MITFIGEREEQACSYKICDRSDTVNQFSIMRLLSTPHINNNTETFHFRVNIKWKCLKLFKKYCYLIRKLFYNNFITRIFARGFIVSIEECCGVEGIC